MRHAPAPRYKPDHTRTIPVVLSATLPSVANNWPSIPAAKIGSPPVYSLVGLEFDSNLLSLPRQQLFSGATKPIRATVGIVQTGDNLQLWSGDFLKDELGNSLAA